MEALLVFGLIAFIAGMAFQKSMPTRKAPQVLYIQAEPRDLPQPGGSVVLPLIVLCGVIVVIMLMA
ncbi:hypothetical protein HC891_12450 [Candidatus Gracilibacteria bacterium]|nr:hypothetical protein [Candidatus Gracilibacteria bacterium]